MSVVGYLDGYIDENNNEYGLTDTVAQGAITAIKDGTTIDSFSDVETVISGIKDGTTIDSFGDVETALADKADASDVTAIEGKIPSGASPSNKMATASDVASRVDWESYAKTGVHQLLDPDLQEQGVGTLTITNDGGVITLNGSQASESAWPLKARTTSGKYIYLKKGTYKFRCIGCSKVAVGTTYNSAYSEFGNGEVVTFTINDSTNSDYKLSDGSVLVGLFIYIPVGSYSSVKWYPLLTFSSDTDTNFGFYAMTNEQLTNAVTRKTSTSTAGTGITFSTNNVSKVGNVVDVLLQISLANMPSTSSADATLGTLPFKPSNAYAFLDVISDSKPYTPIASCFVRQSTGEIVLPQGFTTTTGIWIKGSYICQ